jgi:hypothetical protein
LSHRSRSAKLRVLHVLRITYYLAAQFVFRLSIYRLPKNELRRGSEPLPSEQGSGWGIRIAMLYSFTLSLHKKKVPPNYLAFQVSETLPRAAVTWTVDGPVHGARKLSE